MTTVSEHMDRTSRPPGQGLRVILSFDVEEHHQIEAAAGLSVPPAAQAHYRERLGPPTYCRWASAPKLCVTWPRTASTTWRIGWR